jgi:hypothetical protein
MLFSILEHFPYLSGLAQLILHPLIFFNARNFHASGQELEVSLRYDVRVNCLGLFVVIHLLPWLEHLLFLAIHDRDFSIEKSFELLGNFAIVGNLCANLRETPHIVINLAVQIVLLRDL